MPRLNQQEQFGGQLPLQAFLPPPLTRAAVRTVTAVKLRSVSLEPQCVQSGSRPSEYSEMLARTSKASPHFEQQYSYVGTPQPKLVAG